MNTSEAARALNAKESEVAKVEDSPAGVIITNHVGTRYVLVDESTPDAEGKTGLMLLTEPRPGWQGSTPVYAQPQEDDEEPERAGEVVEPPKAATRARGATRKAKR